MTPVDLKFAISAVVLVYMAGHMEKSHKPLAVLIGVFAVIGFVLSPLVPPIAAALAHILGFAVYVYCLCRSHSRKIVVK